MPIRKVAARQGIRNRSALRQKNNYKTEASRVLTQRALEHVQGLGFILPRRARSAFNSGVA
jgi:CO/xanthine dehydrogenase FAD-binding subunit